MTKNIFNLVNKYESLHEGDNLSDHSALQLHLDIPTMYYNQQHVHTGSFRPTPQWNKASANDINPYRRNLDGFLSKINMSNDLIHCNDMLCNNVKHRTEIENLHDNIINACLEASHIAIPCQRQTPSPAGIPGWQEHVAEQRQQSIFWHIIWKQCGSPPKGVVAELRRRTRSQYHQAAKKAKNNIEMSENTKAANALLEKRTKDF